ncbi:hypothetical protein GobsT_18280 [Gemmata obscuriglobus]|uniref:Uncharacterized protein n=1 Tax=Gemmata obscuriglobus TaxID=114 RepID=A0A2Z3H8A0_9BACT|nr:hypothetical protein [Gemmata obscuriglobus]AWM39806.1 hypothetical protein C1280_24230 [Gemmata obscuriglobus]QEG27075.1 hypothetical protein GobsT_18280 [Gemmata obscuriglobus]VTS03520.1 unnamed protein product [Gemmata obscuriglobus UQM 2246]
MENTPDDFTELARKLNRERAIDAPFPDDAELLEFLLRNGYPDKDTAEEVLDQFQHGFTLVYRPMPPKP